jgi:uncharacterized protein (TIGR02597 family)
MKPSSPRFQPLAVAISALIFTAALPALAQTTATTDPVGFITLDIAGAAAAGSTAISLKGLGLTRPVEYQGSAETAGTNTLVDNEAVWTDNQFNGANGAYYVEIASGPGAGTTYDISATTAATKTITLAQNLASGVTNGVTFKVRKQWTLGAVFGATNEAGLTSGNDAATSDQVQIWNGTGFSSYYFRAGAGWRSSTDANTDAVGALIYPDDGLVVRRISAGAKNVILMGSVKMGQSSFPVQTGMNFLSNVYAAPVTLQGSGLVASGLTGGPDPANADQVLLWDGTGYKGFYYQELPPAQGGTGWRSSGDSVADAGSTPIPVGAAVVIKRKGAAFDWKIPQHPASL